MEDYSLYLHIPFCRRRCGYCDFNTTAGMQGLIPLYVNSLIQEIQGVAQSIFPRLQAHTIFFGGGTPSLLPSDALEDILSALTEVFELQPGAEVTLEANPGTVTLDYLKALRRIGINRLSLGMQSAHPADLLLLERQHGHEEVIRAVQWARQAGFDNLSLDLIFGIPGQTLERWQGSLGLALGLRPQHLSLYALTIEEGTPLFALFQRGAFSPPDDDLAADMYEWAIGRLEQAGYIQYEISNWAQSSEGGEIYACRHNMQYWLNRPYLGFGAGAHGCAAGHRLANVPGLGEYLERCRDGQMSPFPSSPATEQSIEVSPRQAMQETMMLGLRLTQAGVSQREFTARYAQSLLEVYHWEIESLMAKGLLEWAGEDDDRLRLTKRGRLLGNQVFLHFVGE